MDVSPYQVKYVVRAYTNQAKLKNLGSIMKLLSSIPHEDEVRLSIEGKKKQLIEQARSQVKKQIVGHMQVQKLIEPNEETSPSATSD